MELQTDDPELFRAGSRMFLDGRPVTIERTLSLKKRFVAKLDSSSDRDRAKSLVGQSLTIPEDQLQPLPEDQFYHFELVDMSVYRDDGAHLGTLTEIISTPGNDVYVVEKQGFRDLLLPALRNVVLDVDVPRGRMTVHLLEGLEQTAATTPKRKRKTQPKDVAAAANATPPA